ncbi:MAG: hypothetical protein Q8830_03845, partial [Candidatus Phytoplasma australasiaticum]|nr:hypothetical protein [Candidatus Phytoplasma australasiaticum]
DMWFYDSVHKPLIKRNFFKNLGEILIDGTPVIDGNNFIIKDQHSTLPRPHVWDFTGYVVVVLDNIQFAQIRQLN